MARNYPLPHEYDAVYPRRADALKFDLNPQRLRMVVVWPYDPPAGNARPLDPQQHWLDVEAGDWIVLQGAREKVHAVRLWRSVPIRDGEPRIRSGRAWETSGDILGP